MGWTPTRHLKDVVLGLDALFVDLVNFEDPLNTAAADEYLESRESFFDKVQHFMRCEKYDSLFSLNSRPHTCTDLH